MRKAGAAERATLVAGQLAKWEDQNGVRGTVVLQAAHVAGPDGAIGDKSKLQFALARMFTLRAGLPPASHSMEWTRQYEHLHLGLTNLRSQITGTRGQRRGWCSVRKDSATVCLILLCRIITVSVPALNMHCAHHLHILIRLATLTGRSNFAADAASPGA